MEGRRCHPVRATRKQSRDARVLHGRGGGGRHDTSPAAVCPPRTAVCVRRSSVRVLRDRGGGHGRTLSGSLDGGTPTKLAPENHGTGAPIYLPSGWLLWVRARALVAQRLDLARAALAGELLTVAEGVDVASGAGNGQIAYRSAAANAQRQLTWVDRSGAVLGAVGDPGTLSNPRVSPDGRRVVVERIVQGNVDLWLLDGTRARRLTFDAAPDQFPAWSPDGARLAFRSVRSGPGDLYERLTNGAGAEERFVSTDQIKSPNSWSADGRFLLFLSIDPQSSGDLWVVPMALREPQGHPEQGRGMTGDRTPAVFLKTPFREAYGAFSPDGRWVAYHSNESGRMEIFVRPFVPPGAAATAAGTVPAQWQVSTTGGILPVWRRDGKEIFYINPAGAMMAAPVAVTGATFEPGVPVMLFPTRILGGGEDVQQGRQYDVAPDGRFLINTELDSATSPITLLMNWNPEGKK